MGGVALTTQGTVYCFAVANAPDYGLTGAENETAAISLKIKGSVNRAVGIGLMPLSTTTTDLGAAIEGAGGAPLVHGLITCKVKMATASPAIITLRTLRRRLGIKEGKNFLSVVLLQVRFQHQKIDSCYMVYLVFSPSTDVFFNVFRIPFSFHRRENSGQKTLFPHPNPIYYSIFLLYFLHKVRCFISHVLQYISFFLSKRAFCCNSLGA